MYFSYSRLTPLVQIVHTFLQKYRKLSENTFYKTICFLYDLNKKLTSHVPKNVCANAIFNKYCICFVLSLFSQLCR